MNWIRDFEQWANRHGKNISTKFNRFICCNIALYLKPCASQSSLVNSHGYIDDDDDDKKRTFKFLIQIIDFCCHLQLTDTILQFFLFIIYSVSEKIKKKTQFRWRPNGIFLHLTRTWTSFDYVPLCAFHVLYSFRFKFVKLCARKRKKKERKIKQPKKENKCYKTSWLNAFNLLNILFKWLQLNLYIDCVCGVSVCIQCEIQ